MFQAMACATMKRVGVSPALLLALSALVFALRDAAAATDLNDGQASFGIPQYQRSLQIPNCAKIQSRKVLGCKGLKLATVRPVTRVDSEEGYDPPISWPLCTSCALTSGYGCRGGLKCCV